MKTDIVVLSHNACGVSKEFLRRLYEHTKDFRLVWVDNGSTDETPGFLIDFVQTHENIVLQLLNENKGVIGGRNYGYEFCKNNSPADYLCFLDNDIFSIWVFLNLYAVFAV